MNVARGAIIDGIGRVPYDCTTIIIKVMIKVQLKAPQNKSSVDGPPSKDCSPSGSSSWPCLSDGGSYYVYDDNDDDVSVMEVHNNKSLNANQVSSLLHWWFIYEHFGFV